MAEPMVPRPQLMLSRPGIQQDGTRLSQTQYSDGRWTRFYQGLPRKMLGYREQIRSLNGIVRQFQIYSRNGFTYVHCGEQSLLERYTINIDSGLANGPIDRTPAGFVTSDNNNWQFDVIYDTATNLNYIVAHAAPNILDITNTTTAPVYFGVVEDAAPLTAIASSSVAGGVVAVWPYLLIYGDDGVVQWSVEGTPTDFVGAGSGSARPTGTKIVRGLQLRGNQAPAVLLWSLNALVRGTFVGGSSVWAFDTISTSASILSSNGVIEQDGVYYWATVSGFSMFNGVMQPLPNDDNLQWFLTNLNWSMRQKVFAIKIPRWSEIWWCFPFSSATECTHAVIYNYGQKIWYDTELPAGMRSAGMYEQVYSYPIMASPTQLETGDYAAWQHEYSYDEISGTPPINRAIRSYIWTHEFNMIVPPQLGGQGIDRSLSFSLLEPDFNQIGDLRLMMKSRSNARSPEAVSDPITIPGTVMPGNELTKLKWQGRLTRFGIESNEAGGYFEFGAPLIHAMPGDGRRQS